MKRGTLSKNGKPTRLAVELFLIYFQLGGKPTDVDMNPFIFQRISEIMGWEDGEGIICMMWGIRPLTKNSKKHNYHKTMTTAKQIAWDIHTKTC
jgi:hypothetical protein